MDAVIVGAGFAGLYQLLRLRELGLTTRVFEAADDVGGTWYWNRYPGARCDVESVNYSYSFSPELDQEWEWTERFPSQPEVLRYLNHVADRFDLRRGITFETRVTAARFDDDLGRWHVSTDKGDDVSAQFLIMATGCLSLRQDPRDRFPGLDAFNGEWYHTAAWPSEPVDFAGKRVGVIGTGSTGIQIIPQIASEAEHLTVFQRTANFSIPARNRPLGADELTSFKQRYPAHREAARRSGFGVPWDEPVHGGMDLTPEERQGVLDRAWADGGAVGILLAFNDVITNADSNAVIADFIRSKIRETVADPRTAELLCPTDHPVGTKRPCVDTGYFETFNLDNVSLVDLRSEPLASITADGILTARAEYALDAIVFAIGFDAITGALLNVDVRGSRGVALQECWAEGPRTFLGLMTTGFPNLFMITGPQSPSVLTNMVVAIEQHVDFVADTLAHLRDEGVDTIEPTQEAQDRWVAHLGELVQTTLYPEVGSWYSGANVPGKPQGFVPYTGGLVEYRARCDEVVEAGYAGFRLSRVQVPARPSSTAGTGTDARRAAARTRAVE